MWLEAIVSLEDFERFVGEVLPLTVQLGDAGSGHYLSLSEPSEVSLIEHRGLRITCNAEVVWPVLGLALPIHVQGLTVVLEPAIASPSSAAGTTPAGSASEDSLELGMQIEHADVAWLPAALDAKIVEAINGALVKKRPDMSWHFARTLSHLFALPAMVHPLYGLELKVAWGKVRTTSEAMVLVVSFHAHALRQEEMFRETALAESRQERERMALEASRPLHDGRSNAALAVGAGLALLTTCLTIRGAYRLLSRSRSGRHARSFS